MNKLKIGVLMGGRSVENEVSFNSGRTVCDHLDQELFEVIPIFQTKLGNLYILPYKFLHRGKISDFEYRLKSEAKEIYWDDLKHLIDFAYITMHGRFAEDGSLQAMLETLQIPYLGSKIFASALARDKILAYRFLSENGIKVPNHISVRRHQVENLDSCFDEILSTFKNSNINFPCIVKPHKEGSSLGISLVRCEDELKNAILSAAKVHNGIIQDVIVEEKIEGKEFSCIIITDPETQELIALPPTEIEIEKNSTIFDYEQKYMPGRATKHTPARFPKPAIDKIQEICIKVMKTLDVENIIRVDGFYTDIGDIVILDPNTISGMGPTSFLFRQAAEINMSHTKLINTLISAELNKYKIKYKPEKDLNKTMQEKIRVAVLFGGRSNEKEISLESGRNVVYKLSPEKYDAIPVFLSDSLELYKIDHKTLVYNSTKEIAESLNIQEKIKWHELPKIADFVFLGLHGGEGENGTIQGTLEMLGLPYNGSSVFTSALCMDKFKTCNFLKSKGFEVPKAKLVSKLDWQRDITTLEDIEKNIGFPVIIKPHDDGCSVLVHKAENREELVMAINNILQTKDYALVEECITGMELTVGCLGNENPIALPPSQAVATKGVLSIQEKFLPGAGENKTPAPLPEEILIRVKKTMEDAYKAVGCKGYARIDCFYDDAKDRVVIIEFNTLPGLTPATCLFHQAAEIGLSPMEFIDKVVSLGFEEHKMLKVTDTKTPELFS